MRNKTAPVDCNNTRLLTLHFICLLKQNKQLGDVCVSNGKCRLQQVTQIVYELTPCCQEIF